VKPLTCDLHAVNFDGGGDFKDGRQEILLEEKNEKPIET
jgi:hypothetical protein